MTSPDHDDVDDPADNLQDILDELDKQVDDPPADTAPAPDLLPVIDHSVALPQTAEVIPIEDARSRRNLRADLVVEGLHAARSAVAVIRNTFNDGSADFDDAVKALPQLHRLIEHVEKIEAAKKTDPYENLPMFDYRRLPGGGFTFTQIKPPEDGPGMFDDLDTPNTED